MNPNYSEYNRNQIEMSRPQPQFYGSQTVHPYQAYQTHPQQQHVLQIQNNVKAETKTSSTLRTKSLAMCVFLMLSLGCLGSTFLLPDRLTTKKMKISNILGLLAESVGCLVDPNTYIVTPDTDECTVARIAHLNFFAVHTAMTPILGLLGIGATQPQPASSSSSTPSFSTVHVTFGSKELVVKNGDKTREFGYFKYPIKVISLVKISHCYLLPAAMASLVLGVICLIISSVKLSTVWYRVGMVFYTVALLLMLTITVSVAILFVGDDEVAHISFEPSFWMEVASTTCCLVISLLVCAL